MYFRRISIAFILLIVISWSNRAQESASLTPEEIDDYSEQSKQLIYFLEGTLNFLGDPNEVPSEKDIIINQSYAKMFQDDETQVEDDLDPNRDMALNKDVQAYLKDVDFFFDQVRFSFEINAVDQLVNDNGQLVFKVTLNRNLKGITVDRDSIENNQIRYVEINLNPVQKDLKIASIYTTKPDQKEEMRYWWMQMAGSWKKYFGESIIVYDTLPLSSIDDFTDSALIIQRWAEDIRTDTMVVYKGDTTFIDRVADSIHYLGDTVLMSTIHYLRVSDTIAVDVGVIYKNLLQFKSQTRVDISWNMSISNLNPLTELTDLKEIYFSNTLIDDVSPLRNLNDLEIIECSGSKVKSLEPLRYASNLKTINCLATNVEDITVLTNLKNLNKLSLGETKVSNIEALSALSSLSQLDLSDLVVIDFSPLSKLENLSDLNLSGTNITSLDSLNDLVDLHNLNIGNTEITDVSSLININNLSILQANYSKIDDIEPLTGMEMLKFIYCDNTGIDGEKARRFMAVNPNCLVVYNTEELKQWWYDLPPVFKSITKEKIKISEPITTEQLHTIINQTEIDLSGYPEIYQVGPLKMLHRIEKLNIENTSVKDLSPLSGLNNLSELNINNTRIKTLEPLNDLQHLKLVKCEGTMVTDLLYLANNPNLQKVYCDNSVVDQNNVVKLKDIIPECLIIYQSEKLKDWWNGLDNDWQEVFEDQMKSNGNPDQEELQKLVDLDMIEIYDNPNIHDLNALSPFYRLSKLTLSNTRVSDISPLKNLPGLKELNLPNNPIFEVPDILKFKNLEVLNLENTSVENLKIIGKASWIKTLNIAGTRVKKLKGIEGMSGLEKLMINNTQIKSLKEISLLYNLKELVCYRTGISSKTINSFKFENPDIDVNYY